MTIRTELIPVPLTPRLRAEAERWARFGRRPAGLTPPKPEQESVWSYPRPPALQRVLERITVELGGARIVDTLRAIRVCETASPPTYYIPAEDIAAEILDEPGSSVCEWKGAARYHSLVPHHRPSVRAVRCAWSYPSPNPEYQTITKMLAFYPARVDRCAVGALEVRPQPGEFYGGWITSDLVGPFKGEPGSEGW